MLKKIPFVWACVASLLFIACSKEKSIDSSANNPLLGNYKFIGLHVKAESTVELTGMGFNEKTVTITEYFTKDNKGTATITPNNFISVDLSYAVDTTIVAYMYTDGVLTDSMSLPFQVTMPPSSTTSPYKLVGSDSLYFEGGGMTSVGPIPATGSKFTFQDNILTFSMPFSDIETETDQGVTSKKTTHGMTVTTLQKL